MNLACSYCDYKTHLKGNLTTHEITHVMKNN